MTVYGALDLSPKYVICHESEEHILLAMEALIKSIRDHYVEQFTGFVALLRGEFGSGFGEVKFQIDNCEGLFRHLYCVDFLANNDGSVIVREMQPDRILTFEPFTGSIGEADLEVRALRWDDVIIDHDIQAPVDGLEAWFETWFDPEDKRYDQAAEFSNGIHSLSAYPGRVAVDFGTAEPQAFWDLMRVLLDAGARQIRISCTEGR